MGRIGDGDVHAAFVEFRAKDSDKCLSAQCIYCQSVRAKNTSRQRQHLLDCTNYLDTMKQHNPENPILHESINGTPLHTPSQPKAAKKRDHDTMVAGSANANTNANATPNTNSNLSHPGLNPSNFQGEAVSLTKSYPIPKPTLERDFQMSVQLGPRISVGQSIWGHRNWTGYISGHWNGRFGKGTIVPGGQDEHLVAPDLSTEIKSKFLLQTHDHPPAYICVRNDGWRVGPRNVLEKLENPAESDEVDPKTYCFRVYMSMETGDPRYLHLNTGMWIASGIRRGTEVIYDAYRVV